MDFKNVFKADSVVKTLLLCVLTIGIYFIYKLYQFSTQINNSTPQEISSTFMAITIALFTMSLSCLIYAIINLHDPLMLKGSIGIHVISTVFDMVWIFMVRNRINSLSAANKGDRLWLDPIFTSFFHVIYMQHTINQGLSNSANLVSD
ncbi:DUF4234 domain-containing protein [Shewanella sp. 10N.7]|uniref:DUF4234 domain-containing protein n=1 Tax=Shewanella sp. 10N.7 TaxID=2885093 RepID=UPI001E3DB305|nr:DUF4234 domain-containing protein [Shewanella sp. 10N.7]MCC4832430.1 DUF4234 domain-containing protein [Shewanella sp. 10N.7]